ncbi:hypothetical protein [Bradyrhizobium sp. STM 3561]|uniref:hypothetical protein n=1 Tax=Bradyrhizobium sp. STM 3561 TaxID=578923 RepID=UPI00388E2D04
MADIAITAANVIGDGGSPRETMTAGVAITAGQYVYLDSTTNTYKLSDSNAAGAKTCRGVALNSAAAGQPLTIQKGGPVTVGGTLVKGTTYCQSTTPGGICPQADITTGGDVVVLGVATSTTQLLLNIQAPGITL